MAQQHTTVRITGEIEARVADLATRERRSRSQMVQILLEEAVAARQTKTAAA